MDIMEPAREKEEHLVNLQLGTRDLIRVVSAVSTLQHVN